MNIHRRCNENVSISADDGKNEDSLSTCQSQFDHDPSTSIDKKAMGLKRDQDLASRKEGTLFSFSMHLPATFSLLDDDGYISFPSFSEANFLPESFQCFLPIQSPSLVPCFLFIFFFLLSTSFSVPYALTLSFPLALCLCYLEPRAASLSASVDNDLSDSSEDEVCTSAWTQFSVQCLSVLHNILSCKSIIFRTSLLPLIILKVVFQRDMTNLTHQIRQKVFVFLGRKVLKSRSRF